MTARQRVLVVTIDVPFLRGGADLHAEGLRDALMEQGHEADLVRIPFRWYPPEKILDHIVSTRLLDVTLAGGAPVDRVIALKFPAWLVRHPNKVLWILHQHRTAYELWNHPVAGDLVHHPNGAAVRNAIHAADRNLIPEAKAVFTNSGVVSRRLRCYTGIDSRPLYHPPRFAELFRCEPAEDYFFFPSRINPLKRQLLVLESLALTRNPVRVRFAGVPDREDFWQELRKTAKRLNVESRAEWLGYVSDEQNRTLYARSLAVIFPPLDEDLGYVTLEAMLSEKGVITCTDSGGPLEFIQDQVSGCVVNPLPAKMAAAMDALWEDRRMAQSLGRAARDRFQSMNITWKNAVETLLQ